MPKSDDCVNAYFPQIAAVLKTATWASGNRGEGDQWCTPRGWGAFFIPVSSYGYSPFCTRGLDAASTPVIKCLLL